MRQVIIILLFCVLSQLGWASEQPPLPEEPWKSIFEMNYYKPTRWHRDIKIKLYDYTKEDSLMVQKSVFFLNSLVESIRIEFCENDSVNVELYFSNNQNENKSPHDLFGYDNGAWSIRNGGYSYIFSLKFNLNFVPWEYQQNFITNKLAFSLYPNSLPENKYFLNKITDKKLPESIFRKSSPIDLFYKPMQNFDKELIKALFSKYYDVNFAIAKKQFERFETPEWVRKYSHEILVFPFVLVVFLLVGIFIVLNRKLFSRIRDKWLRFNMISGLALPLLGILISMYFMTALTLKYPLASHFNHSNLLAGIIITCILGLPALNVIRLIELAINRKTEHKYLKTLLLFLSTSLIPSGTVFAIAYFTNKGKLSSVEIKTLIIVFLVFIVIGIIRALISFFILKEKEIKIENEVKLANLRELKTKAELNALHSRINPHFLYNSLNSIAGLAKTDTEKTEHMALSLSKLFRYSINKEQSDWSTLTEEMEMVKIYLDIEKVRFDDRLEFTISLPDELKTIKIPRFIIQPLAENAIKHGVSKLVSKGEVDITLRKVEKWMEIAVSDNGPEFPHELAPGFGLQSIYDKLDIMYPNRFELHFVNSPQKQVIIKLQ